MGATAALLAIRPGGPDRSAVIAAGSRMVAFLHGGGRAVVLTGPGGSGKTTTLDTVLAGMPGWVERVGNRTAQPLTVARILTQLGAPAVAEVDEAELLADTLMERARGHEPAVLVIDDAHTLTLAALRSLATIPGQGAPARPGMVLLLSGDPRLLRLLASRGLEPLQEPGALLLEMPAADAPRIAVPAVPDRRRRRPLLAACMVAATLLGASFSGLPGRTVPAPSSASASAVAPASASEAPVPPASSAIPVRSSGMAMPGLPPGTHAAFPSDAQLRLDFGQFLDRSGRDTAGMTAASREALFRDYLRWRAQGRP